MSLVLKVGVLVVEMGLIEWSEKYETGIESIDKQHKNMAMYINEFYKNINSKGNAASIGDIISKLLTYTKEHFSYEEELFEKYNYPEITEHLKAHDDLKGKVSEYQDRYEQERIIPTAEMLGFLIDWFLLHIKQVDFKYVDYLKSKGVK